MEPDNNACMELAYKICNLEADKLQSDFMTLAPTLIREWVAKHCASPTPSAADGART